MFNIASILVLALLAITFIQSGYDKVMDWKGNVEWLKAHFAKTNLKNHVPLALFHILVLELISGILCTVGGIQLVVNNGRSFGLYGSIFSCITLIMLLFGQRN
jgi:uncharacterized membrane protein YphA (DoxX/SURF4 family)